MFTFPAGLASGAVAGYPATAAAMRAACGGYGTWDAGWWCDAGSGNLAAKWGAPTMTAQNSPTYGVTGPRGGAEAVRFTPDNTAQRFYGTDTYDLTATGDLCIAMVVKFPSNPGGVRRFFTKAGAFATTNMWYLRITNGAGGALRLVLCDSAGTFAPTCEAVNAGHIGNWFTLVSVVERTALGSSGNCALATNLATSGQVPITLLNCSNTNLVMLGSDNANTAALDTAFFAIGAGDGIAAGMSANAATIAASLKTAIGF